MLQEFRNNMSSKASEAELAWTIALVESHEGYGSELLAHIVSGRRFDRVHLTIFGRPDFPIEKIRQVTMVRSWLSQAVRKKKLRYEHCAVMGDYRGGDVPLGYYSRETPKTAMARYERERQRYFEELALQQNDKQKHRDDSMANFKREDVMQMANDFNKGAA